MSESKKTLEQILNNQKKLEQQLAYIYKMLAMAENFFFPFKAQGLGKAKQKEALRQFQDMAKKQAIIKLDQCNSPNPAAFKTVHRNITLTAEPFFHFSDGERGHELLSIHDGKFSAIKFGLIDAQNNGISFKMKFGEELEMFLARARYALNEAIAFEQNHKTNDQEQYVEAYKPFKMGKYKGESPASLLFAGKTEELIKHRDFMVANLATYPNNARIIESINKSVKWYKEGKLENRQTAKMVMYRRPLWVNPYKHKGEKYFMSQQRITYFFGESFPCSIEAMEGYGDTIVKGNLRIPDKTKLKNMEARKSININLTEAELRDLIEQITMVKNTVAQFRMLQTLYPSMMLQMATQLQYQNDHR